MQDPPQEPARPVADINSAEEAARLTGKDAREPIRLSSFMISMPPAPPSGQVNLRKRARQSRTLYLAVIAGFWVCVCLLIGVVLWMGSSQPSFLMQCWLDILSVVAVGGFFGCWMFRGRARQCWQEDLWNLLDEEDTHNVGLIIELLDSSDDALCKAAKTRLPGLLRALRASDAHQLTPKHRERLHLALMGNHPPLILAILLAFEQVGGRGDAFYVERLAAGKWQAARDSEVRAAAAECLPFLLQRIQQAGMSQTLLRPSDGLHAPTEELLRPAGTSLDTASEQLLRPIYEEGKSDRPSKG